VGTPEHDEFVAQVVAICNELAGRVQDGQCQRFRGTTRPVSFTTPSGRVDWDPDNEVALRPYCVCSTLPTALLMFSFSDNDVVLLY